MAALIIAGVGLALGAGGKIAGGISASKSAKAKKAAASQYARALRKQSEDVRGGLSQGYQRTQLAAGDQERATQAKSLVSEARRGEQGATAEDLERITRATNQSAGQQQAQLDQMSTQVAQQNEQQRRALQQAAMQADMQADGIDPKAAGWAAAGGVAETLGGGALQIAAPVAGDQLEAGVFAAKDAGGDTSLENMILDDYMNDPNKQLDLAV